MAFQDPRTEIANIFRNNKTLQDLYIEFGLDFEQVQSNLIKNVLYPQDSLIQESTVSALADNSIGSSVIADLNQAISTAYGFFPGVIESPHEDHYRDYKSNNGTAYTFFLKWTYYTYKYYNEEQFFFNNLVDKFVPDYDSQVITSTSQLKIYFDGLGILLDTLDQKIEDLYTIGDIDVVDDQYLQYLAQLLGYQKEDFSIQNISFRELIKNLVDIYQTKGTEYSFELFFKLLGFDAEVREYYWDRDAQNPEQFGSISETDFLWYLTQQDPRLRTVEQISNMSQAEPIQPASTSDFVTIKDLRDFQRLQSDYSLDEILGFKSSDLEDDDRFTYFKTNFIQFRLTQFYTKQDLTAKDTETILKYVKFLTPIYISSFVEIATTPYQDYFEMSNPEAADVVFGGDPGVPPWVDILLPFIFVTIKDYIPLQISPASEEAVVIANYGWSDDDSSGASDDALATIFGDPNIGIDLEGSVYLSSNKDLSVDKYLGVKLDKGRGTKISIAGNTIQTYSQLVTRINTEFTVNSINAIALEVGITPALDVRIRSNTFGTTSKIFLANSLRSDLFAALSATLPPPTDGIISQKGFGDFGVAYTNGSDLTGLNPATTYEFYVNVDIDDFVEVDASGPFPSVTTGQDIVNSINNHYEEDVIGSFVTSATPEYISSDVTTTGRTLIGYRDTATSNGRLVYMNSTGTVYRSGINFSLYDCRNIAISSSTDENVGRNIIAFYDVINDFAKWTVFDNEGVKIIVAQELEPSASGVGEIVSTTLSNNLVAIAYTTSTGAMVKTFDLSGPSEVSSLEWTTGGISNIAIEHMGAGLVVGGSSGTGGIAVYLNSDLSPAGGGTLPASTKSFTNFLEIADINFDENIYGNLFITFRSILNNIPASDETGYITILDDEGSVALPQFQFINEDIDLLTTSKTSNGSIYIVYSKASDGIGYSQVYSPAGDLYKKELEFYSGTEFTEASLSLDTAGTIVASLAIPNRGYFTTWYHLGDISSISLNNRLVLQSQEAGDTWDDTIDNYADTTDQGHLFTMDGDAYEFDNFAEYHRGLGVDFTGERNSFNTFFNASPDDDLIPIIQDTLTFAFTLLVGSNESPAENVDRLGFYIQRNGYISRNSNPDVQDNAYKGYYTRHQDYSEDIRTDIAGRVKREIDWPQWDKDNTSDDGWASWSMGVDYFRPSIDYPLYDAVGGAVFGGTYIGGQFFEFTGPIPIGGAIITGAALYGPFSEYDAPFPIGGILLRDGALYEAYYMFLAPESFGSIDLSGIADYTFGLDYAYLPAGGIELSGQDVIADGRDYVTSGTGGIILSGDTYYALGNVYVGEGGIIIGGTVTADELGYVGTAGGWMTLGGASDTEWDIILPTSGGIILGGSAETQVDIIEVMDGGILIGGTAPFEFSIDRIMDGGLLTSGTADTEFSLEYTMDGGITMAGSAIVEVEIIRDMSGGIIVQGSGAYQEGGL